MSLHQGLIAKQLELHIDNKVILSGIDVSLKPGQVLSVIGPNGAGKTSLLKMLSGQIQSHGRVSWAGKKLNSYSLQEQARQIAVVNQLNESVFALNLEQIVRMGLLPHKSLLSRQTIEDDKKIAAAIARVGLSDQRQQSFNSLSGGEQQRGLIARALVQEAALIVLDEPVNHLDVYYQHQILGLLNTLAKQQKISVIMSLHDLNLAANYSHQICLLHHGKVHASGTPEQVLNTATLEHVFHLPSNIRHDDINGDIRVDFYPPEPASHTSVLNTSLFEQQLRKVQ